jgi:HSP20 family protein
MKSDYLCNSLYETLKGIGEAFEVQDFEVDLGVKGNSYQYVANLAGVEKGSIDVETKKGNLYIRAERKKDQDVRYTHKGIKEGKLSIALQLPEGADASNINADFSDGLLTVTIAKKNDEQSGKVTVNF